LEARLIFNQQGLQVSYDEVGFGDTVLFIHGHPFNRTMWRPQVQSLRWKYRAIAPDLRGYGETGVASERAIPLETPREQLCRKQASSISAFSGHQAPGTTVDPKSG
jgi:pimeloyl-ACP methyl ester carboxylesterase